MEIIKQNDGYYYDGHKLNCKFYKDTHEYWLGYEEAQEFIKIKKLISVTQLMNKHHISTNYSGVKPNTLKKSAEYGSLIHSELENYEKTGEIGFTKEVADFKNLVEAENINFENAEIMVYNDVIAGTIDIKGTINGFTFLADHKTTSIYHENDVRWQLSLYEYLFGKNVSRLLCFHFKNGLTMHEVERIPREQIEKIINEERNGNIANQTIISNEQTKQLANLQKQLVLIEQQKKDFENQIEIAKQQLIENMQKYGIKQIDTDELKITYIAEGQQNRIDTKLLKEEMPEIAEKYTKTVQTKAAVRITLKGE